MLENMDFRARFLTYKQTESYDESAFAVYVQSERGYERVCAPQEGACAYECVYLNISPANTDILKPEVVDAFIRETYDKYYERFPESFGKELVGFFTDEPQYYRAATPYSDEAAKVFASRGKDIKDGLIWLFKENEKGYAFRVEYYRTLNELYVQNFYKKVYDWCEAHGCMLTGHSIEEAGIAAQMLGGAGCMPTYEYEHIPGIDHLCRDCSSELAPKQLGSVGAQLGKKFLLTETFACGGYDTTPKELKSIGDFQYFNGANMTCQHLYPYSMSAQGKFDHPPFFSPQSNWFEEFKAFNDYFTRLGHLVSNTADRYDVAILHPLRNVYLYYVWGGKNELVVAFENDFKALMSTLRKNGVTYQFIDEALLKKYGRLEGDALVLGNCKYDKIIIPKMENISAETYELFQAYTGKLCALSSFSYIDGKPATAYLPSNATLEEFIDGVEWRYMQKGVRYAVNEELALTGLPANHSERAFPQHLLIETDGEKIFYALDGAWFLNETYLALKNAELSLLVLDCTCGDYTGDYRIGELYQTPIASGETVREEKVEHALTDEAVTGVLCIRAKGLRALELRLREKDGKYALLTLKDGEWVFDRSRVAESIVGVEKDEDSLAGIRRMPFGGGEELTVVLDEFSVEIFENGKALSSTVYPAVYASGICLTVDADECVYIREKIEE